MACLIVQKKMTHQLQHLTFAISICQKPCGNLELREAPVPQIHSTRSA